MSNETATETALDSDAPAFEPTAERHSEEDDTISDAPEGAASDAASFDTGVVARAVAPSPDAVPAASPPLSPVESMEVRIDFEVGRVTLPVSKLANVATGSVIEMPGVALDRVVAKSGGHAFAFGEFVELGGRVGFRILKLAEPKEKC